MSPDEKSDLRFPPDFAKGVIRRGQRETRRRRVSVLSASLVALAVGGLGWRQLRRDLVRPAGPTLISDVRPSTSHSRPVDCPWGRTSFFSDDEDQGGAAMRDDGARSKEEDPDPFR